MKNILSKITLLACTLGLTTASFAQIQEQKSEPVKKAWEIGAGATLINWNRVALTDLKSTDKGYDYNLDINHVIAGPQLYVAREILPWLYLDLQGSLGIERNKLTDETNLLGLAGLGAQFRLTPLLNSKYIEPYFRVGLNYMYKNFSSLSSGTFDPDAVKGNASWTSKDTWNPNGNDADKTHAFPVALGLGVNAWMSNSWGLGLQGDYLMQTQEGMANFAQVSLRVMYRIGGADKRPKPVVEYVERVVEVPVEKIVEKEVIVEKFNDDLIYDLLRNVTFEFDRYVLTPSSEEILDKLANVLKRYEGKHFLLTGLTDARGSDAYNYVLSRRRAKTVKEALIKRGVPATSLKARGGGKRIAALPKRASNQARQGDRKVIIEIIYNDAYWNALKD